MRRGEKGFTLVELAIVLVIIGIIIGAVVKGQDLIDNSRVKKFVTTAKQWEISMWTYMDRKGFFAGDPDKSGKIDNAGTTVQAMLSTASFINQPWVTSTSNTISVGSYTFEVFFGTDGGANAGKNIMIICKVDACDELFDAEELMFLEGLDVAVDGNADGDAGQIVGTATTPTIAPVAANWYAGYTAAPVWSNWADATQMALVYYFDAKR